AAGPRDNRRPVFVIVAPTGLALPPATTRAAPQGLFPTPLGLTLLARGVVEVIRFHHALHPASDFVGRGRIPQPPAPARAGPALDTQLPGNASRRTRQAQDRKSVVLGKSVGLGGGGRRKTRVRYGRGIIGLVALG